MEVVWGFLIPFLGTCLGSLLVLFFKDMKKTMEKIVSGVAAGSDISNYEGLKLINLFYI